MNSDYSALVLVRNRTGISMPFSSERLATSLGAAGIDLCEAFAVATELERAIREEARGEVDSERIAAQATEVLVRRFGPEVAERYRGWRRFQRSGTPLVVCLHGAPGVGKSAVASRLAQRLSIQRVVPTEAVRDVLRTVVTATTLPELHVAAHAGFGARGDQLANGRSGLLRQARAVTGAMVDVASKMIDERRHMVVFGSHLMPGMMTEALRGRGAVVLEAVLTLEEERLHRQLMLRRLRLEPGNHGERHLTSFAAIRSLQEALVTLAREHGVTSHDVATAERLIEWVVDHATASGDVPCGAL